MAASDKPGGHDREPPGKKPGGKKSFSNGDEDTDMSSDAPRVTRSGRLIAPAQRRAGRRVTSRATSRAFSSRGDSVGTTGGATSSHATETSRPISLRRSSRLPAKRPQVTIDLSSDPPDLESDEPEAGPSSRPAKRPKPSSAVPRRDQVSSADVDFDAYVPYPEDLEEEISPRSNPMVFQNYETFNRDKVQMAFRGMTVELGNDLVSPRTYGIRRSLDVLLSLPKKHNFQPQVEPYRKKDRRGGNFPVRDTDQWSMMARDTTRADVLMVARVPQGEYTQQEANILCNAMVEIINRWEGNLDDVTKPVANFKASTRQARLLLIACRHKELPQKRIICQIPSFTKANPEAKDNWLRENRFSVQQSFLHPTTYKLQTETRSAGPRLLQDSAPIPELSDRYQFVKNDSYGGFTMSIIKQSPGPGQPPTFESLLPSEEDLLISQSERESLQRAERLLRLYSASIMNHAMLDTAAAYNIWTNLLEKYGGRLRTEKGYGRKLFDGSNLLRIDPRYATFCTSIKPGDRLAQKLHDDHDLELPLLIIRSTDRAWCLAVEQAICDTWLTEADILKAWTHGAEVADQVNQAIRDQEKPPSACLCTPEMSAIQSHPCSRCGKSFICNLLVVSSFNSQRVCQSCNSILLQRPINNHVRQCIMRYLKSNLRNERMKSQDTITEAESALNLAECMRSIEAAWPSSDEAAKANIPSGSAWRDRYSGNMYSLSPGLSASRVQHDRVSIDATFPVWLTENGYRTHCPQNISLTLQCLNFAKQIQIPAFLAMVCWFTQERTRLEHKYQDEIHGPEARIELDSLETKMIKISKRLRIIRLTFGFTIYSRTQKSLKGVTQEEFDFDIAPVISGRPHPGLQRSIERLDTHLNFMRSSGRLTNWPEDDLARVRRVAEEIIDFFGVSLPRGDDGCPFFAHPESFPETWSWNLAFRLAIERLTSMRKACNRFWPTYDTTETILFECIFQTCIAKCILDRSDVHYEQKKQLKEKYKSILGLPIALAKHDGLKFAIGHREHGKGMFSGWPIQPVSLKDRLNGDGENNMLIEPRNENYLKSDYDSSIYPKLKEIIMDIDLPKEVYDKTHKPKDIPEQSLEDLAWNGEEVGDELLQGATEIFQSGLSWPEDEDAELEDYEETTDAARPESEATGLSSKALGKMPVRSRSIESHAEPESEMQSEMQSKYEEVTKRIEEQGLDPSADLGLTDLLKNLREAKDREDEESFMAILAVLCTELN